MDNTFTTTSKQGWGARLGNSFKGIVGGLVLFVVAFPLLWWNEGRTVKQTRALNEGAEAVVEADSSVVNPAFEGKLVHTTGVATNLEMLSDETFSVSADALVLRRDVQMYQWVETAKTSSKVNLGGSETTATEYFYQKEWAEGAEDSADFAHPEGHQNPKPRYASEEWTARTKLGAYDLPSKYLLGLGDAQPVRWAAEWVPAAERVARRKAEIAAQKANAAPAVAPAAPAENAENAASADAADAAPAAAAPATLAPLDLEAELALDAATPVKKLQDLLYVGKDPNAPEVGDLKITFSEVKACDASVVAAQQGSTFAAWTASNGRTVFLLANGIRSAEAMFTSAHKGNKFIAWLLRLLGFLLMLGGLKTVLAPLRVLGDVLPLLGRIVGWASGVVAFFIALPLTLVTIGLAWVAYRPYVGIPLLVVAGLLLAWGIAKAFRGPRRPDSH